MKVKGTDPETGKPIEMEAPYLRPEDLPDLSKTSFSKKVLKEKLDGLAVSADVKMLLHDMASVVIYVSKTLIRIGQKILEAILRVLESYPNLGIGLVFGIIAAALLSTIPIIGALLGKIVAVIIAAFGLKTDFDIKKNKSLAEKERKIIVEEIAEFDVLKD